MGEGDRSLRPLRDAGPWIDRLEYYREPGELAEALIEVRRAAEETLRLRLRSDAGAPDALRLAALSAAELPIERVVEALRERGRISIDTAGLFHELGAASLRAETGEVRAADADAALRLVMSLRADIGDPVAPARGADRHPAEQLSLDAPVAPVPAPARRSIRGPLLAALFLVVIAAVAVAVVLNRANPRREAIAAFRAGRMAVAEQEFRAALARDPADVTSLLYLARIERRDGRLREAGGHLSRAAAAAPEDPDVRRELGYLFLQLGRPDAAAEQFGRAVRSAPEEPTGWAGWIRALRAAGDTIGADTLLLRAPAGARRLLEDRSAPPS